MSSTDERRLERFYRTRLVPAAEALRARGVSLFPLGPDDASESWYVGPPREPKFATLEVEACEDALRELWQENDRPELAALAEELMEIARRLEVRDEDSADVSPFVYVMY